MGHNSGAVTRKGLSLNESGERASRLLRVACRLLIIGGYLTALAFGFLCVLYHSFFIWYSSLDGDALSVMGVMIALANMLYPAGILALFMAALASKRWNSMIFKPQVCVGVLLLIPVIFYLHYILVESLGPYNYSL